MQWEAMEVATKTFSSRADEAGLAYADAVARQKFGMSFGQYCGSVLVDAVCQGLDLPEAKPASAEGARVRAISAIKAISSRPHDAAIGRMSDAQIADLLASRHG